MERMSSNFPNGGAMDTHFANMRYVLYTDSKVWYMVHVSIIYLHCNRLGELMSAAEQSKLFYEQDTSGAQFVCLLLWLLEKQQFKTDSKVCNGSKVLLQ